VATVAVEETELASFLALEVKAAFVEALEAKGEH
jgi:hypothetical protein